METAVEKWRTSSYTGNGGGNCIEVADITGAVMVRDTKDRDGLALNISAEAWRGFTDALK